MRNIFIASILITFLLTFSISSPPLSQADEPPIPPIVVIESSADRLVLGLTTQETILEDVQMRDGNMYTIAYTNRASSLEAGKPNVPVLSEWILVPNGNTDDDVFLEIDPGTPTTEYTPHPLAPLQYSTVDLEDAPMREFVRDEVTYAQNEDYPGRFADREPIEIMRGHALLRLRIYPYQYNPADRRLNIYDQMTLTITFASDLQPIQHSFRVDDFDNILQNLTLNGSDVLEAEDAVDPGEAYRIGSYGWDYLIFTAPDFEAAANTLAAWKQKKGFKTLVTKIPAYWVQDDIKSALLSAYNTWDVKPKYVLLIGDSEYISPYYKTWHPWNTQKYKGNLNTQGYIGTDLYYSTLKSKDPIKPDGDLLPEVLLGRLSVDEDYEAMDRVNAIINYEKDPPPDESFYDTVAMAAMFQDGGVAEVYVQSTGQTYTETIPVDGIEDKRFTQTSEDIAIFLESAPVSKFVQRLYFGEFNRSTPSEYPKKWDDNKSGWFQDVVNFNGPTKNTIIGGSIPNSLSYPTYSWSADADAVKTAVNAGTFLLTHRDHGGRLRWSNPAFDKFNVYVLANTNKLPFVWSLNCQTGWFDNETDFKGNPGLVDLTYAGDESFSEIWERPFYSIDNDDDNGALAVVAATRVTYGSGNERLAEGMTAAIWPKYLDPLSTNQPLYKLGAIMNFGKQYMSSKMSNTSQGVAQLEGYHLFGDPTVELRTQKPPLMAVSYDNYWEWAMHQHDFGVFVRKEDDSPISKAKVTITKSDGSSSPELMPGDFGGSTDYWTGITNDEGQVIFPDMTTTGTGIYDLVVTAPDYLPHEGTVEITPGPAGGIALDKEVYACQSEIVVTVADSNQQEPVFVTLTSERDDEVIMELAAIGPGVFSGVFTSAAGEVNLEDGILQLADGEEITASYLDGNIGEEGSELVTDEAVADCQAPIFGGLITTEIHGCNAHLTWEPASDPNGLITYMVYQYFEGSAPGYQLIGTSWMPGFVTDLCNTPSPAQFLVRAQDAPGNEDENDSTQSIQVYKLILPIVSRN